jgi:mono/diheme cytochrome c family protein
MLARDYRNIVVKKLSCLAAFAFIFIAGCAGGPTPVPDAQSAAARLYTQKCGACHSVPHPGRNTAAEWQHLFGLMEQRMAERNMPPFTNEEKTTLLKYLQTNAR